MRLLSVYRSAVSWVAAAIVVAAVVAPLAGCESPRGPGATQAPPSARPAPPPAARGMPPVQPPGPAQAAPQQPRPPGAAPGGPSLAPYLARPAAPGVAPDQPAAPPPVAGSVRVALLVPLSGMNAPLGRAMLSAGQLALFDWADEKFEMVVHDTGDSPEGAARAAQDAIADGAQIILGPLLAQGVRAVAPVARAAGVPVVAFSSDRSVAGAGVHILGFQPEAEVRRIVGYARSRGHMRFAALAPDNDYGRAVAAAMRETVAAAGAVVVQVQFYDPNASDHSDLIRRFANYDVRREALLAQRRELESHGDEISKRALTRLERLQTLGDLPFDALLLPEGGQRLQAIAALLPFFDIDPAKIKMLGTGRWDQPGLGAEPALVGGWYPAPSPDSRAVFEKRYRETFGHGAPRLATLAYDAGALAAVLAKGAKGADFSPAALTQAAGFAGSDGIFRLRPDGSNERGLAVLQVQAGGLRTVSKSPEVFGPATN